MTQTLEQLNKEYTDLQAKYKNNYKVVEFYPTVSSVNSMDVGCVAPDSVKLQKISDQLHTPDSCKTAVSIMAANQANRIESASKTQGLQYTLTPSSVSGISTNFTTIESALGGKMPSENTKFTVVWEGFILPDVDGKWGITLSTNSVGYAWIGQPAIETYNEFNPTIKLNDSNNRSVRSASTSMDVSKGEKIPIRIVFEYNDTHVPPVFFFSISAPNGSVYASPEKMYECLHVLKNEDGTMFRPPQTYYAFVENSPEDTAKNLFQCHYGTSLNGTVPYKSTDNTGGFYHSVEEVPVWRLLEPNNTTDMPLIKPGNAIKIDAKGVHLFNAQNVIVKTLYSFQKNPLVRYIRIERNEDKNEPIMLNINEIEVFDESGKIPGNQMSAKLSPQYGNSYNFGASYLIDNHKSSWKGNHWSLPHTNMTMNSYMEVDLLKARPITKVLIHNRNDCCKERILRGQVVLLDGERKRVCKFPITQIMNVYEYNLSKTGCKTSSSTVATSNEGTGVNYKLGLVYAEPNISISLVHTDSTTGKTVTDAVLFNIKSGKAHSSHKWKKEQDANGYTEYSDAISFTRPLISSDARFKLAFAPDGNLVLYSSRMGCQSNAGNVNYRSPSNPNENQFIYGIQNNKHFNKTYYINEMGKTMQYLPRNNPMLTNTDEYTEISGYVPSEELRKAAIDVDSAEDCKKKCNDVSGCPWYSIFGNGNKKKCVIGTTQTSDIVSPEMMTPIETVSGAKLGSMNIRNKQIPLNTKYMLGDNIPFMQMMKSSDYAPYSSYQKGSSIAGETPVGFLSEKDVQDYFTKQKQVIGTPIVEGLQDNTGIAIVSSDSGKIPEMEKKYLNPSIRASSVYANNLVAMRTNETNIGSKIGEYEKTRSIMNSNRLYHFHPDDITTFQDPPTLADGIDDDNKEMLYQQNLVYATTGIAVLTLGIAAAMIVSRSS